MFPFPPKVIEPPRHILGPNVFLSLCFGEMGKESLLQPKSFFLLCNLTTIDIIIIPPLLFLLGDIDHTRQTQ